MKPLVECVPNFSEGESQATLGRIREAIAAVPGTYLLDIHADVAHHRSVFTFVGAPHDVMEAAFQAVSVARGLIDLRSHRGEHPRMGATDVVPIVPIEGVSMDECVGLARALGQRIGDELEIPVYLYARAATRPDRERLPDVRQRGFEALRELIGKDPAWDPDYGPRRIHPSAGATAVGARPVLVAFNVFLQTSDVAVARAIARRIRASSGGMPAVQAKGFMVDGLAQVSTNLLDIDVTAPLVVFNTVRALASNAGVGVGRAEIVGLVPERAVVGVSSVMLNLADRLEDHILEARIRRAVAPA